MFIHDPRCWKIAWVRGDRFVEDLCTCNIIRQQDIKRLEDEIKKLKKDIKKLKQMEIPNEST